MTHNLQPSSSSASGNATTLLAEQHFPPTANIPDHPPPPQLGHGNTQSNRISSYAQVGHTPSRGDGWAPAPGNELAKIQLQCPHPPIATACSTHPPPELYFIFGLHCWLGPQAPYPASRIRRASPLPPPPPSVLLFLLLSSTRAIFHLLPVASNSADPHPSFFRHSFAPPKL